ncbi:hypothetical protein TRIP_D440163 [uncultured Paludibacter sp.]|uniref:Uncharacterized protein n=1 Tax=uncultured Paludibacter sp. TaxID=497635 RepID=A0A653AKB6_9BACT|nr:hypothetical protein TRIP_D440163 [uncultured Paludibacter sp.]
MKLHNVVDFELLKFVSDTELYLHNLFGEEERNKVEGTFI